MLRDTLLAKVVTGHQPHPFNPINLKLSNLKLSNLKLSNLKLSNLKLSNLKLSNLKLSNLKLSNPHKKRLIQQLKHRKKVRSPPEAVAKAKNVPATLSKPQGDYTLVTVVEGADANSLFNKGLQVVGAQRQRLAALSQQFDKTPVDSVQQRDLIAGQMKETKKKLKGNLRFMAQKYAYSLKKQLREGRPRGFIAFCYRGRW